MREAVSSVFVPLPLRGAVVIIFAERDDLLTFSPFAFRRRFQEDPTEAIRDIFVQEIMGLRGGEFDTEKIDMDSISFSSKRTRNRFRKRLGGRA